MPSRLPLILALAAGLTASPTSAADCTAEGGLAVDVNFSVPENNNPSTVTVAISYPTAKLALPGRRNEETVNSRFSEFAVEGVRAINDQDGTVRVVLAGTKVISPGRLFQVAFDRCRSATAVSASELTCVVVGCAGPYGKVNGCDCAVAPR